ncbi:hypothetical protein BH20ACT13_BH20ACT13_25750 [soil metagenome]
MALEPSGRFELTWTNKHLRLTWLESTIALFSDSAIMNA